MCLKMYKGTKTLSIVDFNWTDNYHIISLKMLQDFQKKRPFGHGNVYEENIIEGGGAGLAVIILPHGKT